MKALNSDCLAAVRMLNYLTMSSAFLFASLDSVRAAVPVATTFGASNVTGNSAALFASVNPRSASTTVYFQWGLTTNYTINSSMQGIGSGSTAVPVQVEIDSLASLTNYYFRVVAQNSSGTSYGSNRFFTTLHQPPEVGSGGLSSLTSTSATFFGSINTFGFPTVGYFQWGTTTTYGSATPTQWFTNSTGQIVYAPGPVTGLTPSTTYHFRFVATNEEGIWFASDMAFITDPPVTAITLDATNIGTFGVTLAGLANPNNASPVSAYFEYGGSINYGSVTATQTLVSGSNDIYVTARASNLVDGTAYHYRLVIRTNASRVSGSDRVFTTGTTPADVQTLDATNVTGTNAVLVGSIAPNSVNGSFIAYFDYGLTTSYGQTVSAAVSGGTTPYRVQLAVNGLNSGQHYHFRLKFYRVQRGETFYGGDQTFTTLHIPAVTTGQAVVMSNMVTLIGTVNPNNASAMAYFEWGPTVAYGNTTPLQALPPGSMPVSVSAIIGPLPVNQYHFRVVAGTLDGSATGADETFVVSNPGEFVLSGCSDAEIRAALLTNRTVRFSSDCFINLTNPIPIPSERIVDASGHTITISGGNSNRLFDVRSNASLSLVHLVIANGRVSGTNGLHSGQFFAGDPGQSVEGGGILLSNATLAAVDCAFTNCTVVGGNGANAPSLNEQRGVGGTGTGGAISAHGGAVILSNCVFTANSSLAGSSGSGQFANDPFPVPASAVGGAIAASGAQVTISSCVFRSNSATSSGGAIDSSGNGTLVVAQTTFSANAAQLCGGAVNLSSGSMALMQSILDRNQAVGSNPRLGFSYGGALCLNGNVEITDCDFATNSCAGSGGGYTAANSIDARNGHGGAVAALAGRISIARCTFRMNLAQGGNGVSPSGFPPGGSPASGYGGGLYSDATTFVTNCTFALNQARAGSGPGTNTGASGGGAMAITRSNLVIASCTIASNKVSDISTNNSSGGGLYQSSGTLMIVNSILSGNAANTNVNGNATGTVTDGGHNISSDAVPAWTSGTSLDNTDPLLLPLANNGGPTLTMALRTASPALNSADCAAALATDQRGFTRPDGDGCDIGAYEGPGVPQLQLLRETGSTNVLRWYAESNRPYRVEDSSDLSVWSPIATNAASANGWREFRVPANPSPKFFRLVAQ